jgi:hypothetical protein
MRIPVEKATRLLRISYWAGAIADGLTAMAMLEQAILARPSPLRGYVPEIPYRYAMVLAASLMLGWTTLLIWADRRPYERRGVLLITIPVVFGLASSGLFAVALGFIPLNRMAPILLFQALLVLLFASSFLSSRRSTESIGERGT